MCSGVPERTNRGASIIPTPTKVSLPTRRCTPVSSTTSTAGASCSRPTPRTSASDDAGAVVESYDRSRRHVGGLRRFVAEIVRQVQRQQGDHQVEAEPFPHLREEEREEARRMAEEFLASALTIRVVRSLDSWEAWRGGIPSDSGRRPGFTLARQITPRLGPFPSPCPRQIGGRSEYSLGRGALPAPGHRAISGREAGRRSAPDRDRAGGPGSVRGGWRGS